MKKILALTAVLLLLVFSMGPGIAETHGQNETTDMVSQVTGETTPAEPPYQPPPPFSPNRPPVAEAGPNQTVYIDQIVEFSGADSTDPDGYLTSWTWIFGDGAEASGVNVSHTYSEPGNYTVTLTVVDVRGGEDSDTCTITVRETPPLPPPPPPPPPLPPFLDNLTITPSEIELGDNVTISFDIENFDSQSITYAVDIHIENVNDPPPTWPPMDVYLRIWVDLGAYESKTVSHTITPETVGDFNVTVHGMTGSFTVEPEAEPEPEPEPAEFVVSGLTITLEEVEERKEVTVSVDVTNVGEERGVYTVELVLDGVVVESEEITPLGGGALTSITIVVRDPPVGVHTVQVGALTGSFEVKAPPEPEFEFSNLSQFIIIEEDMDITFFVNVSNVGDIEGTHQVDLKLDGEVVYSINVTLPGGATEEEVPLWIEGGLTVGTYQVEVEGLIGSFTVFTTPEPPFWTSPEFVMVVSVIIAAAVILYAYLKGILPSATTRSNSHGT